MRLGPKVCVLVALVVMTACPRNLTGLRCEEGECLDGYRCVSNQCVLDDGTPDGGADRRDAGGEDAAVSSVDAGAPDAASEDAGVDAGEPDAGGQQDAGSADAGSADAGSADAGSADAGLDAGPADAAQDAGAPEDWWNLAWSHRVPITVGTSAPTVELIDFPVLVKVGPAVISESLPGGVDVRFVDPDNNVMAFEMESWTNDDGAMWVKVPRVGTVADELIGWLYFGNAAPGVPPLPTADVWSTHSAVWHLSDGTDASPAGIDAISDNSVAAAGLVGGAREFLDQANNFMSFGDVLDVAGDDFYVSLWAKPHPDTGGYGSLISKDWQSGWALTRKSSGDAVTLYFKNVDPLGQQLDGYTTVMDNLWHHFAVQRSGDSLRLFVDGNAEVSVNNPLPVASTSEPLLLGRDPNNTTERLVGLLDEVRYTVGQPRTASWVRAEFDTINGGLIDLGTVESQ